MAKIAGIIGMVTPGFPPRVGGVEEHVAHLTAALSDEGIKLEIITTTSERRPSIGNTNGLLVRRFPLSYPGARYSVSVSLARWLLANSFRYALLHAHSYHTPIPLISALAAGRAHIPYVVTPHFHGRGHTTQAQLLHHLYRPVGRRALLKADAIICVSRAELLLLQRSARVNSTHIIPNGVAMTTGKRIRTEGGSPTYLVVGRAEQYKQLDVPINALRYLPPEWCLTLVTQGPQTEQLRLGLARASKNPQSRLLSAVSREDLEALYHAADVVVTMSTREAFGMTVIEAAAAGCAIVASDIPAHREVAARIDPRRVRLVDASAHPRVVADAIRSVFADLRLPARDPRIATWRDVAIQTAKIYRAVLSR